MMPNNQEAERALLGSLLIDHGMIAAVQATGLQSAEFYGELHGSVYQAMCDLAGRGIAADYVTLADTLALKRNGDKSTLEAMGGSVALTKLLDATPTHIHAAYYAGIVRDLASRRRLIQAAAEIAETAHNHTGPIDELRSEASRLFNQAIGVQERGTHLYGDDLLVDYLANQSKRQDQLAKDPDSLVTTPWSDLNRVLIELEPGMVHVVAAPTSVGKTIYMECIAEHNAQHGKHVVFYHLELSHQAMLDRRMARHSGIPTWRLRQGYDGKEIHQATQYLSGWQHRIIYVHCPGWRAERIVADLHRLHGQGMAQLAVVDYLNKLALPPLGGRTEASAIGDYRVEPLKTCAEQLAIPIITGSQLNRARQARGDKRATQDDLRGSGEIAEKANQVVVIHRKQVGYTVAARMDGQPVEVEFQVEKNTNGQAGTLIPMMSIPGQFKFLQITTKVNEPLEEQIPF